MTVIKLWPSCNWFLQNHLNTIQSHNSLCLVFLDAEKFIGVLILYIDLSEGTKDRLKIGAPLFISLHRLCAGYFFKVSIFCQESSNVPLAVQLGAETALVSTG